LKSRSARRSEAIFAWLFICLTFALAVSGAGIPVRAQSVPKLQIESPILTIDSDRMFADSRYGQQTIRRIEALGAALAEENTRIQQDLEEEEQRLTDLRPTISPEEFRDLADAFDAKVQETRRRQEAKSRELNTSLENRRVVFLNYALPVLEQLMRETGAAVVLEQRSVFISSNLIDITQVAIERLDMVLDESDVRDVQGDAE
jgi:Skp family chaperone for outer membrane proteins